MNERMPTPEGGREISEEAVIEALSRDRDHDFKRSAENKGSAWPGQAVLRGTRLARPYRPKGRGIEPLLRLRSDEMDNRVTHFASSLVVIRTRLKKQPGRLIYCMHLLIKDRRRCGRRKILASLVYCLIYS